MWRADSEAWQGPTPTELAAEEEPKRRRSLSNRKPRENEVMEAKGRDVCRKGARSAGPDAARRSRSTAGGPLDLSTKRSPHPWAEQFQGRGQ